MPDERSQPLDPENVNLAFDENPEIRDGERLPIQPPLKVLRYRTIKKSTGFGWWSVVALVEDHGDKQICFYRWRKKAKEWKRDKKLAFKSYTEWSTFKEAIEYFLEDMG